MKNLKTLLSELIQSVSRASVLGVVKEGSMSARDVVMHGRVDAAKASRNCFGFLVRSAVVGIVMLASITAASAQVPPGAKPLLNAILKSLLVDTAQNGVVGAGAVGVAGAAGGTEAAKKAAQDLVHYHNIPIFGDVAAICEFTWAFGALALDEEKNNQCEEEYLRRLAKRQQMLSSIPQDQKEQRRREICEALIDTMTSRIKHLLDVGNLIPLEDMCDTWSAALRESSCTSADATTNRVPPSLEKVSAKEQQEFIELRAKLAGKCLRLVCDPGRSDIRCATKASTPPSTAQSKARVR